MKILLNFSKYSSIENTYQEIFLQKVRQIVPKDLIWDISEKVHGANCSILTNGDIYKFGKRTKLLDSDENFYKYKFVLNKNLEGFKKAYDFIKTFIPDIVLIQFFGELFGGIYPHKDVIKDTRFNSVQKGIYYAPYQEFYGFDILVTTPNKKFYLNPDIVEKVYKESGIFYARSLFKGTLDECLQFPNTFQTKIPEWLGFPPIDDNTCEGIVIKPMIPQYLPNGDRIILKNKNDKFAEKKKEKIHKEIPDIPEEIQNMINIISSYITENRLVNIISHEGEIIMPRDLGKLIKVYSEDILSDFIKENEKQWNSLEKSNQKIVTKNMNFEAISLIKQYFKII